MSSPKNRDLDDRPVPRPAKSPAQTALIRTLNRRREYLERHPSYFEGSDREFADPILYERLIKRHQTPQERQTEGVGKGYAHMLEADLARGESRLSALATEAAGEQRTEFNSPSRWKASSGVDHVWDERATTRERGRELWKEFLRERFVQGGDEDFQSYEDVDGDEDLDGDLRREEEER
ncbi:hypothetical protein EsDP_00003498 [Epichloe bromicola]|uniref:CCD97-like C-terminal domain-containing protein n=1 Tax=Epichloe bromicola TaxID=79588 RepID=A0ABQ0CNW9_9HYPO